MRANEKDMETIRLETDSRGVTTLTFDRPEVHNAFDEVMIAELQRTLVALNDNSATRILVFKAEGKSFSAGADLNWMRRAAQFDEQENYDDAMSLATMLETLDTFSKPTLAFVQGAVFGGGVGLISCCDIVLTLEKAVFSLSEVKLGLVPAVISPYVVRAIGVRAARRYFQSAERFDSTEALRIGLVHDIVDSDDALTPCVDALLQGGPNAQNVSKKLIATVAHEPITRSLQEETARTIASVRTSGEGREGVSAFLEKRRSRWTSR